ncbi:MAG: adenosylcobinamide-phosphate synthase CbiB [Lachnospiraceae bacterium]|nr:adenosylcobinamide-phosphate synthase CbiB [Lachnospiraceae bacterium]
MICHCIAFLAGFLLDLILGDPHWLPHPIRLIGKGIGFLEKKLNQGDHRVARGAWMTILVLIITVAVIAAIVIVAYRIHPIVGVIVELILTYYALALRSLRSESMKVYRCLKADDLEGARKAVSMIVGRDTEPLDQNGITRAAVETVAENTSDGIIAPMIFLAIGGPVLGFFYKAVNTMDSMVGYKNDRYLLFGRASARLDDVFSFVPARVTAFLMLVSCLFAGKEFHFSEARRIYRRDRLNHASPNAAQAEAVCAGALGIRLAGDASYFGQMVKKPYIGDDTRPIEDEDIKRTNRLMLWTAVLCEVICLVVLLVIWAV